MAPGKYCIAKQTMYVHVQLGDNIQSYTSILYIFFLQSLHQCQFTYPDLLFRSNVSRSNARNTHIFTANTTKSDIERNPNTYM